MVHPKRKNKTKDKYSTRNSYRKKYSTKRKHMARYSTKTKVKKNEIDTIDNLKKFLNKKKINTKDWGKDGAKSVDDLLEEIKGDETILLEKGEELVRVISAVWVKMLYKVEEDILPESLENKEQFIGDYYLIETCTTTIKPEIRPKVTAKTTTTVAKVDGRYETDMMLPNYKGKPLAGKQTASDASNGESIRESALNTVKREICEELNIILTSEDFTPFMMVEWYPKNLAGGGGITPKQKNSIREFIEKTDNPIYNVWFEQKYHKQTQPADKTKTKLVEYFKRKEEEKKKKAKDPKEAEEEEKKKKAVTKIQASFRANSKRKKDAKEAKEDKLKNSATAASERSKKRIENEKIIKLCEPCSENSIKHEPVNKGKLVTWEWIKDAKNDEGSGTTVNDMPPIKNARPSKSYPSLPTLYQIIHLRTKNLADKKWGTQWMEKKLDTEMLTTLAKTENLMEVYPPPYCTWQEKPSPFCFNVYENPANKGKCKGAVIAQAAAKKATAKAAAKAATTASPEGGGGKRKKRRTRKRKKKGTRKRKKKRTRKHKRKKRSKN